MKRFFFISFYKFRYFSFTRAYNICTRFPDYKVAFHGIGPGPKGSENLGCCSQLALFVRIDFFELTSGVGTEENDIYHYNNQPYYAERINEDSTLHSKEVTAKEVDFSKSYENRSVGILPGKDVVEDMIVDLATTHIDTADYRLIRSRVYPRNADDRSREQKIVDEAIYHLGRYMNFNDDHYDPETHTIKVPVTRIFDLVYRYTTDINEFK